MATLANHLFSENWPAFRAYLFSRADAIFGTAGGDTRVVGDGGRGKKAGEDEGAHVILRQVGYMIGISCG